MDSAFMFLKRLWSWYSQLSSSMISNRPWLIGRGVLWTPWETLNHWAFTGTKGKTTAAYLLTIFEQSFTGPAMLSTMNTTLDGKNFKSTLTTPESLTFFAMMAEAESQWSDPLIMGFSRWWWNGLRSDLDVVSSQHQSWPYWTDWTQLWGLFLPQTSPSWRTAAAVINTMADLHFQVP